MELAGLPLGVGFVEKKVELARSGVTLQLASPKLVVPGTDPRGKAGKFRRRKFLSGPLDFFNRAHAAKLSDALG